VEELLCSESRRSDAAAEVRGDVEGQQLNGLQNTRRFNEAIDGLGGKFERFNKVIDEVEEEPRQFNSVIKEGGGQMQTLTKIKSLYVDIRPVECDWVQFQMLERGVRLAGTSPIINESEFSGVGSRADVAMHISSPPGVGTRADVETHIRSPFALPSTSIGNRGTSAPSRCGSWIDEQTVAHGTVTRDVA